MQIWCLRLTATLRSWPSSGGHVNTHSFAVSQAVHLGCMSCWAEKAALNLEVAVWEMGWRNRLPSLWASPLPENHVPFASWVGSWLGSSSPEDIVLFKLYSQNLFPGNGRIWPSESNVCIVWLNIILSMRKKEACFQRKIRIKNLCRNGVGRRQEM